MAYKCSQNGSTLVEDTLSQRHVGGLPKRLIADRPCDSDRLDERLRQEHSLELIVSNRRRRKRTQDGRPRAVATADVGKSSGCFAWLKNYCRICSRWETPCRQLSRNGSSRMHVDSLETSMRLLLVFFCVSCPRQPRRYQQREAAK
jgi:hypothetical protein